jgi:hypothetical protein
MIRAVVPASILQRWDKLAALQLFTHAWHDLHRADLRIAELQRQLTDAQSELQRWEDFHERDREETLLMINEHGCLPGLTIHGQLVAMQPRALDQQPSQPNTL